LKNKRCLVLQCDSRIVYNYHSFISYNAGTCCFYAYNAHTFLCLCFVKCLCFVPLSLFCQALLALLKFGIKTLILCKCCIIPVHVISYRGVYLHSSMDISFVYICSLFSPFKVKTDILTSVNIYKDHIQ